MEPDDDFWVDDDDSPYEGMEWKQEEFPEGWIYNCCDEDGESKGCKTGDHVEPGSDDTKKAKLA